MLTKPRAGLLTMVVVGVVVMTSLTIACSNPLDKNDPNPSNNRVSTSTGKVVYEFDEQPSPIGGLVVNHCPGGCEPWDCKGSSATASSPTVWSVSAKTGTCLKSSITHGVLPPEANASSSTPALTLISGHQYQYQVLKGCDGSMSSYSATCFTAP